MAQLIGRLWSDEVMLSLAKNVAYNVVNEKTTYGLFKALSNMFEKPSASNKVFLIRQLVNTKMKEGASVADHVNKFNSILSRRATFRISVQSLEVNMAARDSDDALVCCVKNTVEDHIMDSDASFHATYCKEELERLNLHSGKTLKDVRYILKPKEKLSQLGSLDEEGYP
ncbi:hypothetical protein Tco_0712231 [Tanacetum coccineum]